MKKTLPFSLQVSALISAVFLSASSLAQAQLVWNGSDMTWTQPDADSFDNGTYNSGNDVTFDGTGQGTVSIDSGGVTPGNFQLTDGTYNFTGGNLHADSFTLSGGVLRWNSTNQLGTGAISVTGDATIESMATATGISMTNAITVSNGVALTIVANNNTNPPASSAPSVGSISGGTEADPVTVRFQNSVTNQGWRLSSSTFVGDVVIGGHNPAMLTSRPITFSNFQNDHFGHADNSLSFAQGGGLVLSLASSTSFTMDRDMDFDDSFHLLGSAGPNTRLIVDGKITQAAGTRSISAFGTLRLTNSENEIARMILNNPALELTYLPSSQMTVFAQGGTQTLRFVGDLTGSSALRAHSQTTGTYFVEVESADANITLTESQALQRAGEASGPIVKTGPGTLNITGDTSQGANAPNAGFRTGVLRVDGGRLNIHSTFTNVVSVVVNDSGTFGGNANMSFVQNGGITINEGGTLAPGASIGTMILTGFPLTGDPATAMGVAFQDGSRFQYELDSSVGVEVGADLLKIGSATVDGHLSLDGVVELTLTDLAVAPEAFAIGTTFTLINYTGDWNGGFFTHNTTELENLAVFTAGLNQWQIEYNATTGGLNFDELYEAAAFVNITAVPEPSIGLLFLGAFGVMLVFRHRRTA